ncbi:3-keto-disaccharide hydrolase [Algoriphagus pacificus]|uniref:DUF1080 domain-containing protein n=1 Tax=Algoriphagus pacificus TaxID=2811234 RepID=A0ABS3CP68_9BACT|nr:DUF1080 domain-containing protein [Algoriphagus pacificus]MBN7817449.1 DUF1080 domain-containing protein [Algoriphagus pacificus]
MLLNPRLLGLGIALTIAAPTFNSQAQTVSKLTLDSFTNNKGSWKEVGKVWTDLSAKEHTLYAEGDGTILLNAPAKKKPGADLISEEKFGDVELKLVYMMAEGSNSGLYLQGQYEIQLLDSWQETNPKSGSNGGVYERWDESKPAGQNGFQGYAPRQNVSKAPGIWQTLEVGFQAPRFASNGEKTQNAILRYVRLNGVTIHENLELFGPTRGALAGGEVAEGPIRIQGDHGPVAIQSLEVKRMDISAPDFKSISYTVYPGSFNEFPEASALKADNSGKINSFDDFKSGVSGASMTKFEGTIQIKEAGNYTFDLDVPRGLGALQIGAGSTAVDLKGGRTRVEKSLPQGDVPYVLWVSKPRDWTAQGFNLSAFADGMWPTELSAPVLSFDNSVDPIWVESNETPVLRSFVELPNRTKLSHAVSVSSEFGTHFTYDLETNQLIRVWRGAFIDATPMWHSRGNGVSRPLGVVTELSLDTPLLLTPSFQPSDIALKGTGYQILGNGDMEFGAKSASGLTLKDHIKLMEDGKGVVREMEISGTSQGYQVKIMPGKSLKKVSKTLYLVEDTGAYLEVLTEDATPQVGSEGIYLPLKSKLSYVLLF